MIICDNHIHLFFSNSESCLPNVVYFYLLRGIGGGVLREIETRGIRIGEPFRTCETIILGRGRHFADYLTFSLLYKSLYSSCAPLSARLYVLLLLFLLIDARRSLLRLAACVARPMRNRILASLFLPDLEQEEHLLLFYYASLLLFYYVFL